MSYQRFSKDTDVKLPAKVSQEIKDELIAIAIKDDRKLSYIIQKLLLRGLAAYRRDGLLKEPDDREI